MQLPDFLVVDSDGNTRFAGHRLGLLDFTHYYQEGYSPEMLAEQFPTLPLSLIHKAIAFYLDNQTELDTMQSTEARAIDAQRQNAASSPSLAELRARLSRKSAAKA